MDGQSLHITPAAHSPRGRRLGAAGTVRTQKTAREEEEIRAGTAKQKKILGKEKNRGLDPTLAALKLDHATQIEWGKLYGCLSNDNRVLQVAWKDQNMVLFMTTVHTGKEYVERLRRRPGKTATCAYIEGDLWGSLYEEAVYSFVHRHVQPLYEWRRYS